MVYIAPSGRRFPDKIRFDPEEARRVIPKKLVAQGWKLEDAKRAVETVIEGSEEETNAKVGAESKSE